MEVLPSSLSYSASKQSLRYNRFLVRPNSTETGGPGSTFRFRLPSKSLVNMSSFCMTFDLTISNLVSDAANYANAKLPHGHKLISALKVYVGGQLVSGGLSNHYDILYNALCKASVSEDWCRSRMNEHAIDLIQNTDDAGTGGALGSNPTVTEKKAHYVLSDFLGVFRGNGGKSIIDTSLWGDVEVEVTLNNTGCIGAFKAGTGSAANVTYKVENIESYVDCITQTTPLYIKLITMLLDQRESQIRFPYQNFVTNVSSSGSNARFQVNSGSIDALVCAPLAQYWDSGARAAGTIADAGATLSANRYRYNSGKTLTAPTGCNMQIQIGSDTFPKIPISNGLDVSDITTNSLFSNSLYSQNLLFVDAGDYKRSAFLDENFVWIQSFGDQEGWASKILTGIDTASQNLDIVITHSAIAADGSLFMGALLTSMLVFDTKTGIVSVVQ
jgi:hypothetical protein